MSFNQIITENPNHTLYDVSFANVASSAISLPNLTPDVLYLNSSHNIESVDNGGTAGQVLTSAGTGNPPIWQSVSVDIVTTPILLSFLDSQNSANMFLDVPFNLTRIGNMVIAQMNIPSYITSLANFISNASYLVPNVPVPIQYRPANTQIGLLNYIPGSAPDSNPNGIFYIDSTGNLSLRQNSITGGGSGYGFGEGINYISFWGQSFIYYLN